MTSPVEIETSGASVDELLQPPVFGPRITPEEFIKEGIEETAAEFAKLAQYRAMNPTILPEKRPQTMQEYLGLKTEYLPLFWGLLIFFMALIGPQTNCWF